MKSVKAIVKKRLKELGWKPYDLSKAVRGKVAPQTVYSFINGKREMNTRLLPHVLDALGLEIVTRKESK